MSTLLRIFFTLLVVVFLAGCDDSGSDSSTASNAVKTPVYVNPADSVQYAADEQATYRNLLGPKIGLDINSPKTLDNIGKISNYLSKQEYIGDNNDKFNVTAPVDCLRNFIANGDGAGMDWIVPIDGIENMFYDSLTAFGYQARRANIHINQSMTRPGVEVFVNGKWIAFDIIFNVYFTDYSLNPVGYDEMYNLVNSGNHFWWIYYQQYYGKWPDQYYIPIESLFKTKVDYIDVSNRWYMVSQ